MNKDITGYKVNLGLGGPMYTASIQQIARLARAERTRYLTEDEEERLLSQLTGPRAYLKPIVVVAINTGGVSCFPVSGSTSTSASTSFE
jgi:hypothetical protein